MNLIFSSHLFNIFSHLSHKWIRRKCYQLHTHNSLDCPGSFLINYSSKCSISLHISRLKLCSSRLYVPHTHSATVSWKKVMTHVGSINHVWTAQIGVFTFNKGVETDLWKMVEVVGSDQGFYKRNNRRACLFFTIKNNKKVKMKQQIIRLNRKWSLKRRLSD